MTPISELNHLSDLKNKVAVVTGGAGHLGEAFVQSLLQYGVNVISLDKYAKDEEILPSKVHCIACDLAVDDDIQRAVKYCEDTFGRIDILINNAAFVGTSDLEGWAVPFEEQSIATWRKAIEVNLTAVFNICQLAWPLMKTQKTASIINISSIYGQLGPDNGLYEGTDMGNPAAYGASKGGVNQLTRWLATNMAPSVRVNALALGGIERGQAEEFIQRYVARTPMKRMGIEDDMVGPMLFLASNMSKYVTGQIIPVDGGWSAC